MAVKLAAVLVIGLLLLGSLSLGVHQIAAVSPRPQSNQSEIFVTDRGNTSIRVFARLANGNVPPVRVIQGGNTLLSVPTDIDVDSVNDEIVVANTGNSSITVHSAGASGNVAPLRRIAGPSTGLAFGTATVGFDGIYVDSINDEIGAVNRAAISPSITIYSRHDDGNVAPLRTIQGVATTMLRPKDIDVDTENDEIFVTDVAGVLVFARTASGNAVPLRTLHVSTAGGGDGPVGVKVDPVNGELWVQNGGFNQVLYVYARTASGNEPPLRSAWGGTRQAGVFVDPVNGEAGVVDVVPGYRIFASSLAGTLRQVFGTSTGFGTPVGIAIGPLVGQGLPDLMVTSLAGPSSGAVGGHINVSMTVTNQGSANAGPFRVGFYFSTDPTIATSDTFSGWSCAFSGLAKGTSDTCSGPIGVPASLLPGTYYLGAIADDSGQVIEVNENNNARAADGGPMVLTPPQGCPVQVAVQGTSGGETTVETLRTFRDGVLASTAAGQRYTRLFYARAPEVTWLMVRQPELRLRSRALLGRLMPSVRGVLAGRRVIMPRADIADTGALLAAFAAQASPDLRTDLDAFGAELRQGVILRELGIEIGR